MATDVIGREDELASIESFFDRVETGPAALVLSGEAGIGKTILWESGVEEARGRFGRVLSCHGVEAEASLSYAGLSDLLADSLDDIASSLPLPRRRALEVALLLAEPGEAPPDPHAIGLAVLDALRALAERGPVLVALDDAQWLDPPSAGVLQIALRRLREEPIGLLATLRLGPDVESAVELERVFSETRLVDLSIGPLSLAAVQRLLTTRLGLDLTRPEITRVQDATAGNPFFALELGRELVRTNTRPTAGRALPMPESLQELLGDRLARLPTHTGDVLLQAAALARPTLELVTAAYGEREPVLEALEAAVREGVVGLDDSSIRFTHPLLASISYEQAPVWKRRAVHRALANVVTDVEERARHLALAAEGPDSVVASYLDAAAEQAAARGAPRAAGELSELAADMTPDDPLLTRRRRLQAGKYYSRAGSRDQAVALLDQLLEQVPPGPERADVLLARISTFVGDTSVLLALSDEALDSAEDDDVRSARVLASRTWVHLIKADGAAALADGRAALRKAEQADDPTLVVTTIARLAQAEVWGADVTPGLLERGVEIEERLGLELDYRTSPRAYLPRLLMRRGELGRARAMLEEAEASSAASGDAFTRTHALWYLSILEWLAGRWQLALAHAATANDVTEQLWEHTMYVGRFRALIETDLGLVEQARASAEGGLAYARSSSNETFLIVTLGVLGRLELALGNLEAAGDYLRELPGRLLAGGLNDPTQPLWSDAIETLVALGELEQAGVYLEDYERYAGQLGSPLAMEGVLRCRGLLYAATGDVPAALAAFDGAIAEQPIPVWPFERGRTLLCLGVVRRQAQQKRAARENLEQALALFEELGARLWADKARAELRRIGGRAPTSDDLTETERRVAELAGRGRSNKEIAAELFMGVSTVEAHLSHVYRKLGVRRAGLASRLAIPVDEPAEA